MSTAYLMACYAGPRLSGDPDGYEEDRLLYIRTHVEALRNVKHNLDDIFIILNEDSSTEKYVLKFLEDIDGTTIQNATVHVIRRENIGVSYGAYTHFFKTQDNLRHNYYILMEDDYVPVIDDFDQILIDLFNEKPGTSFMCSLTATGHRANGPFASISNGITTGNIVRYMKDKNRLKHSDTKTDLPKKKDILGQVAFSDAFNLLGAVRDYTHKYQSPYWHVNGVISYGKPDGEVLLAPQQWRPE